jgi:hypothetical protein
MTMYQKTKEPKISENLRKTLGASQNCTFVYLRLLKNHSL